jgi:hypothetical protein
MEKKGYGIMFFVDDEDGVDIFRILFQEEGLNTDENHFVPIEMNKERALQIKEWRDTPLDMPLSEPSGESGGS